MANSDSRIKMSVMDAFNEFYKLKSKYESDFNKEKQKIIKNKTLSWREKKQEFKKLKQKCVNCKRPVGTIFSIKHVGKENDDSRELKAICGSLTEPCNLNITINPGVTFNILNHIKELENDNDEYKNEIIDYKNKLLFGYTTTDKTIEKFDKTKEAINDITFLLNFNYERLFEIIDNKTKNEQIDKLKEEVYIYINEIKQCMKDFNTTTNVQFVRDAIDIYVNQMKPKMDELMGLKYKVNLVEFDEYDGMYHLVQKAYGIVDLEDDYVEPSVISFDYGDIYNSSTKEKGKTNPNAIQPLGKEENIVTSNSNSSINNGKVVPIYNDDGTITWENPDYEKMWNKLPAQYRKTLLSDTNKQWLQDTMDKYVQYKNENKPLEFVMPSNLIIPPKLLEDGKYDFGNDVYNNIFNKLDKSYQKTLLTLYSEKDGKRNYNMMIDTINNIVKQQLGFTNYV
jgi:hypothetical protein